MTLKEIRTALEARMENYNSCSMEPEGSFVDDNGEPIEALEILCGINVYEPNCFTMVVYELAHKYLLSIGIMEMAESVESIDEEQLQASCEAMSEHLGIELDYTIDEDVFEEGAEPQAYYSAEGTLNLEPEEALDRIIAIMDAFEAEENAQAEEN